MQKHLSARTIFEFLESVGCTEYKFSIDSKDTYNVIYDLYIVDIDTNLRLKANEPCQSMLHLITYFL